MRASSRLSLAECRGLLGRDDRSLTDEQLRRLRDRFYDLAALVITAYQSEIATGIATLASLSESNRIDVEERAAIMQFDGNLTREQSEKLALDGHLQSKSRH
jgi:hypothetical protein